jgi:hypothetical protein
MYRVRQRNLLREILVGQVYKPSEVSSRVINHAAAAIHLVPTKKGMDVDITRCCGYREKDNDNEQYYRAG